MQVDAFREWIAQFRSMRSANDCISRCKKVERTIDVNLDDEYAADKGKNVLAILSYGQKEANAGEDSPVDFSFKANSNCVQRYTDLRCSVKKYFEFLEKNNG